MTKSFSGKRGRDSRVAWPAIEHVHTLFTWYDYSIHSSAKLPCPAQSASDRSNDELSLGNDLAGCAGGTVGTESGDDNAAPPCCALWLTLLYSLGGATSKSHWSAEDLEALVSSWVFFLTWPRGIVHGERDNRGRPAKRSTHQLSI